MEAKTLPDASAIFRCFAACPHDPKTLLLDVRPHKQFEKLHLALSYNIRLSANGRVLLDYSKNQYDFQFTKDCWWGKPVIVYGEPGIRKDHPVVKFLSHEGKCKSLSIYRPGYDNLEERLPFLCTQSIKANSAKRYPSEILPRVLYLGEWSHAEAQERLSELNVRRVITIHNSPENMELPPRFRHLKFQLADVDTQNVAPYFNASYDFIEEARAAGHATLVHCGAGVSRSAALVMAYLMRRFSWNAAKARADCVERRSVVQPNDGFWRSLCAFEAQLGIGDRSDVNAGTTGWHGTDADTAAAKAEDAAGAKVEVTFLTPKQLAEAAKAVEAATAAAAADADRGAEDRSGGAADRQRDDSRRYRSRSPAGERRHREAGRGGDRRRSRSRSRSRDRERRRRDGRSPERRRDDGRLEDRGRGRSGSPGRRGNRREERNGGGGGGRERPAAEDVSRQAAEATAQAAPPKREAVFEVSKDGKALGELRLGLQAANQRVLFGRVPSCEVHLEHLSISRHHAQLTLDASGHLFLTDLGAAHGTNVDGTWMKPHNGRQLQKGNVVRFGASSRQYKLVTLPSDVPAS